MECESRHVFNQNIFLLKILLNFSEKSHDIMVKIMKGDRNFRDKTKSTIQCSNEVYIYKKVIPYFKSFLNNAKVSLDEYQWVPKIYFSDFGLFPDLSDDMETILALENLNPLGYRMGPRIDLDEIHLKLMIANIARYHSISYAMKIKNDEKLKELTSGLVPLSFLSSDGTELESYAILFNIGLERFFRIVEENEALQEKVEFIATVKKMKEKIGEHPSLLMESLLKVDEIFSVLLHGDYNRNNVLFQYPTQGSFDNPSSIKMIDFQETRFATPAIDLAFFMYMNMPDNIRKHLWDDILKLYHETVIDSLIKILRCEQNDSSLDPYSFENFISHFKNHAFYGIMVTIHFIPWIACPDEECEQIAELFEKDMKNPKMRQLLQVCGGEEVDKRLIANVLHAFESGYLDLFE